jgi:transcriptional regulator GlxA family with amidase domain
MKHISILVPAGECSITNIEGTYQVLCRVNDFLEEAGQPPMLTVQLVGLHPETQTKRGLFRVYPDILIKDLEHTDLVIIPAVHGDMNEVLSINQPLLEWVVKQYNNGAAVASLCIGAFLLAGTGLVNGLKCATHWEFADTFRKMFPEVDLVEDKILTDENGIYSSGGAYSWLNLILYLVEKYAGRAIAVRCAKGFQVDIDRDRQSPFIIFKGQKEHQDEAVKKVQEYIEKNVQEKITVGKLASFVALGRRNLERRFKKATSNTVVEYMQRVKIEAVKKSLESSRLGVNEAMDKVGYSDPKTFRVVFKKVTGLSPLQYRNKYNKEFVA